MPKYATAVDHDVEELGVVVDVDLPGKVRGDGQLDPEHAPGDAADVPGDVAGMPPGDGTADAAATFAAKADQGYVNLVAVGDTITITTCFQNDCATATEDTVANTVEVAE